MATLSNRRKEALRADATIVEDIYARACQRFGADTVRSDVRYLWTMRCILGVQEIVPFDVTVSQTMGELLYVAREACLFLQKDK